MAKSRTSGEWRHDYATLELFVAHRLGAHPGDPEEVDAAIRRASEALDADPTEHGERSRRFLAIEFTAWSSKVRHGRPTPGDWERAVATVDAASDVDVRRWTRGGMVIRAAQGGWAK